MSVCSLRGLKTGLPPNSIRIDRATLWGNPFAMKDKSEAERRKVIAQYKNWLWGQIQDGRVTIEELAELHGKDLYCWCHPSACHGDILEKAAEWAFIQVEQKKAQLDAGARAKGLTADRAGGPDQNPREAAGAVAP